MQDHQTNYVGWKHWEAQQFGQFSTSEATYFAWHLARALPAATPPLNVLELGFGNGNFLGWACAQGHRVQGIEALPELVARAQAHGFAAAKCLQDLPSSERFDLVVAFDVVEHIPLAETPGLLNDLRARLRPEGRLVLRFPNAESPFGQFNQLGDLTHVTALGVSRMRQLALQCHLTLEHAGDTLPWRLTAQGRPARAWWRHWLRKRFGRRLRKLYGLGHLDYSPNQLVVLRADNGYTEPQP
jgi:2-polyprenyl-3-methyl-5-hydroxy-6-metoxy-1,4-benzoquinol methylase